MILDTEDPVAVALVDAIHSGDLAALERLLGRSPHLATARLGDPDCSRTLLHVVADWPGHFPQGAATVALLVQAGADVNARWVGASHEETPLHWAASSDDLAVLDALLDEGADIDAHGGVMDGGGPLSDARIFAQWNAAHRLVERGARTNHVDEATLGLMERLVRRFENPGERPARDEIDHAFWGACHGGQLAAARFLHGQGADLAWTPSWENLTPLDAAVRSNRENNTHADDLIAWLRSRGAKSATGAALGSPLS